MWSDPKSTNMAHGNQWMNPTFYKNMTNEQVDWSSLAHQWIKMKETSPVISPGQKVNIPLSEHTLLKHSQHVDVSTQNPSNLAAVTNTMLSDYNISRNKIEKPRAGNTWTLQQQQSIWRWVSTPTAPPAKELITESVNSLGPLFIPPTLSEKPPCFPIMTPNTQFPPNNYWAGPNTTVPTPSESDHWNKLNVISKVDDRTQDLSFIDAAKRKQLPVWIREGLETMEREKRRKIEQKQSLAEPDYSNSINENVIQKLLNSPINFDLETHDDIELLSPNYNNEPENIELVKYDSSPLIPRKTKAQIWEDTMLSLRKILTKLLMDVTNDMMLSVVKNVLKTTLQTDIRGNQNQTSLANKLGLEIYDSESESSDESDDGHHSSGRKELKQDSDEAIQERILKRQYEFSNIEARILMELDQLEDKEKLVRSKFDNSIKLSREIGSQVVENIQTKGLNENVGSNLSIDNSHDIVKKELPYDLNIKNGHEQKKSKYKSSSSSSSSSSSRDSMDYIDLKHNYKKNDKIDSKSPDKDSIKRKSRSSSRSNRSRSHSRHSSRSSCSRHYDKRFSRISGSRRSRSPPSRHSYSRKYKNKRNSSSGSNDSSSNEDRYRR